MSTTVILLQLCPYNKFQLQYILAILKIKFNLIILGVELEQLDR